jgi:ABC-type antimicrobial peptide transport system permease subunit
MPPEAKKDPFARYLIASDGYFTAMGIQLLSGRFFSAIDDANAKVAIINAAMAKLFWADQNPVGRTFIWGGDTMPITVVGVVADVREAGLDSKATSQMYFPLRGTTALNVAVVARGSLPPKTLLREMTAAIRTIDPTQAVYRVRMMDEVVGASVASRRANTMLISLFAFVALLVSALGVYAVTANAVVQRMREFGIRSALGATGRDLLRHVGGEMTWVAIGGVATGAMLSWWLSHVMTSLLYEIQVHDVQTFAAVPLVLVTAVVVATLIPARRVVKMNPVEVMRNE